MANLIIVSGGQSGVDRAALEVAVEKGIDYGGGARSAVGQRTSSNRPA